MKCAVWQPYVSAGAETRQHSSAHLVPRCQCLQSGASTGSLTETMAADCGRLGNLSDVLATAAMLNNSSQSQRQLPLAFWSTECWSLLRASEDQGPER